ncbi:protein disulfide isomerase (PDI) protein [Blyttiomyces sp. JEL0837]|nr:protein disulfide isomerase (PDI) protein [Blyttiomyces sp. JEL0837]
MHGLVFFTTVLVMLQTMLLPSSVQALYSSKDPVVQITDANFKKEVLGTNHAVILEFFAPWCGHCKALAPEFKKAGEKLKGLAKVAAVDCDVHKELCGKFGIQGFPTLKVFGSDKKQPPTDYQGPRTAKGIVDFMIPKIPSFVQTIGSKGKQKSLDDFLSEEPELAKVVLVSNKDKTPPLFKALSTEYNKRLTLGELRQSEKEFVAKLNVEKFPAVLVFPKGVSDVAEAVKYDGDLKHAGLVKFLDKYAIPKKEVKKDAKKDKKDSKKKEKKETKKTEDEDEDASATTSAAPVETQAPFDPIVHEVTSQETLEELCTGKPGVCVVSLLALESEFEESVSAHKSDLDVITKMKKKYYDRKSPLTFVWLNPLEHGTKLRKQFDISDSYPGLFAVNSKKGVYRIHLGAFDEVSVSRFLDDMMAGRGRNVKLDFIPELDEAKKDKKKSGSKEELLLLEYAGEKSDTLKLAGKGSGGLTEFKSQLKEDQAAFGFVRVIVGNDELSQRAKFVFITWCGSQVKVMRKAKLSVHIASVKQVLKSFSVEISASALDDLIEKDVIALVKKSMGANYDGQGTK